MKDSKRKKQQIFGLNKGLEMTIVFIDNSKVAYIFPGDLFFVAREAEKMRAGNDHKCFNCMDEEKEATSEEEDICNCPICKFMKFKKEKVEMKCGNCGIARYCSRDCQKIHWKKGKHQDLLLF